MAEPPLPMVRWSEGGVEHTARWRSERGAPPPRRVMVADDSIKADAAYRLACEGTALLWRGDYQNARQLLLALARRIEQKERGRNPAASASPHAGAAGAAFHRHRLAQAQRAQVLGMLLLPLDADYRIPLRRAPEVRQACLEAYGPALGPSHDPTLVSLREILGLIGAHQWRKKGVAIPALGATIHPHYGVFSPIRGEYLDLVVQAPLPSTTIAFDIGTGTGVIAALLAKRGVARIVATDKDPRALACARENLAQLGLQQQVEVLAADLFPPGQAPLIVCNPPWLPARPSASVESAVYDPDSRMLMGFLKGLAAHLTPGGEGWLILSDLAEQLGLRTRQDLLAAFAESGLTVLGRLDVRPRHPKADDRDDPLHAARSAEVTSLWRLGVRATP